MSPPASFDTIADALVAWAIDEERIRGLWIEGAAPGDVRRPYSRLEAHLAAEEPSFQGLVEATALFLERDLGAEVVRASDAVRFAREFAARLEALSFTVIVERTPFLAKRPRAEVTALLDRSGHLTHVMDFSKRKR